MPLMTTKPMFDLAYTGGFAVGAFNVNNMELAQAILDACAREKSPLILQISKGARKYANIRYLKAIIDAGVAEYPDLPIAARVMTSGVGSTTLSRALRGADPRAVTTRGR